MRADYDHISRKRYDATEKDLAHTDSRQHSLQSQHFSVINYFLVD